MPLCYHMAIVVCDNEVATHARKSWYFVLVFENPFKLVVNIIFNKRIYIYNRTIIVFSYKIVVFRLRSRHRYHTFCHGGKSIGCWSIGIYLIKHYMRTIHHFHILLVRYILGNYHFALVWVFRLQASSGFK